VEEKMIRKWSWLLTLCFLVVCAASAPAQISPAPGNKWEEAIRKFEEADRQNPPAKGAVLFIGSSSIQMWKNLAEDFPQVKVINRGFGGSEITDSTYYVDRIVAPYQPRIIVFYAGDNDLASGKTPQKVFEDYQEFVKRVKAKLPEARIAFISIKPSLARASLMQKMCTANEMIRRYAANDKHLIYIDVFTPMLGQDGMPRRELFGPDGLHMNKEGYSLWRGVIAPYLR
jgi:lysophospholipase L1-like esterase